MFATAEQVFPVADWPSRRRLTLARETSAGYRADTTDADAYDGAVPADVPHRPGAGGGVGRRLAGLGRAVDAVVAVAIDELDDVAVEDELAGLQRQVRRLQTRCGELAAVATTRHVAAAEARHPRDPRAGQRAERHAKQRLRQRTRWSPTETNRAVTTGRDLDGLASTRAAARAGDLGDGHVGVIARIVAQVDPAVRAALETELVDAARDLDPVALGDHARRRLAELDHDAAMRDLNRRHHARAVTLSKRPDGTLTLWGRLAGVDAETVATALDAFRTPDTPGAPRRADQRTADALAAMARAALDHGLDTTAHGSRPHVTVMVDWSDLTTATGAADTPWTGPLPVGEIRRLLDDAAISRVITGPDSLPLDTGRATRHVTAAIWRALVARDRHCTYPGCDAPPAWCQAAHFDRRWTEHAGVSTHELALVCHHHHRLLDRLHVRGRLHNGTVIWERPNRTSATNGRPPADRDRAPPD